MLTIFPHLSHDMIALLIFATCAMGFGYGLEYLATRLRDGSYHVGGPEEADE